MGVSIVFVAFPWGLETFERPVSGLISGFMFVAFPWGLETIFLQFHNMHIITFVAFPWGLET